MKNIHFNLSLLSVNNFFYKILENRASFKDPRIWILFTGAIGILAACTAYALSRKKNNDQVSEEINPKEMDIGLVKKLTEEGWKKNPYKANNPDKIGQVNILLYERAFKLFSEKELKNDIKPCRLKKAVSGDLKTIKFNHNANGTHSFKEGFYNIQSKYTAECVEFWVDFAAPGLGGGCFDTGTVQEETLVKTCPNLAAYIAGTRSLGNNGNGESIRDRQGPHPLILQNVVQVMNISREYYGPEGLIKITKNNLETVSPALDSPLTFDMLAMALKRLESSQRTVEIQTEKARVSDIFHTVLSGFMLAEQVAGEQVKVRINSGKLGCGAYGNNKYVVALAHIYVAKHLGMEVVLHDYKGKEQERIRELLESMPKQFDNLEECADAVARAVKTKNIW